MSDLMQYHRNPISMREGKVFLDGYEIFDAVKCEITFTPDVWTGKQLGDRNDSSRWLGYSISGTITRRRTTKWTKELIMDYISTGKTPELTIQGISDDQGSEFYDKNGSDTVTVIGCVPTGDLTLLSLDADGDVLDDEFGFNAKGIV